MSANHLTMHDLPADDRPYEKMLTHGAKALSDAELMAVIIRSGSRQETAVSLCQRLLGGLADETDNLAFLRESSLEELTALPGIGRVKALQLRAAVELGSRAERSSRRQTRRLLKRPEDAYALLESEMVNLPREELRVILLDARNRLIRVTRISEGGLSSAVIHPRDLFREAVKANAAALILVHNHPSGDATPSPDDLTTTRRMCETGEMMGIRVVDHLILARGGSVSLKQTGLM